MNKYVYLWQWQRGIARAGVACDRVKFCGLISTPMRRECMATIDEQLQTYRAALADAQTKGDQAIARKLEQQVKELEAYQQRHPEAADAPSPLEVFCDLNPSNINCRVYDD
jgi:hypothetical protein